MSELLACECRAGDGSENPPRPLRARYAARLTFEFSLRSAGLAGRPSPSSTTTLSRMVGSSWTLPMLSVLNNLSSSMRSRCPFASMGTEFWKLVEVAASEGLASSRESEARAWRVPRRAAETAWVFSRQLFPTTLKGNRSKFRVRVGEAPEQRENAPKASDRPPTPRATPARNQT